ncbi:MAG: hypothetical protein ABS938_00305 [Psychrobacillus psychrodurans]
MTAEYNKKLLKYEKTIESRLVYKGKRQFTPIEFEDETERDGMIDDDTDIFEFRRRLSNNNVKSHDSWSPSSNHWE